MRRAFGIGVFVLCLAAAAAPFVEQERPDPQKEEAFIGKRRNWWSFRKVVKPAAPAIRDPWIKTPIDAFILDALRKKQLQPSPPISREKLIRRLTVDLTGLPPSPGEVDEFVNDQSPGAYERLVDRLLASPHYGERWAQRWLDVARYADTNGYELDAERLHAWRYRDYVVASFNADKPYDRFVKEQIAGDELYPASNEALIATGFHRAGPIHLVGGNQDEEMNRQEVLSEYAYGVSSVFLGVTMQCAKCHNHKFDPLLQADYYRMQAIFGATEGKDVEIATPQERREHEAAVAAYKARLDPVQKEIEAIEKPYKEQLREEKKKLLEPKFLDALNTPKEQRTPEQQILAKNAQTQSTPSWDEVLATLTPADRERRSGLRKKLHEIELTEPDPLPTAYAVENMGVAKQAHILKIGDPKHKLAAVDPGFPTVLSVNNGEVTKDACSRRSALANWIASAENPLTARVMVNRIWQLRMGSGLVRTPNDFGLLGERPTNAALLDWLAAEFVERGWGVKALDRMIVLSSVYQQSTANNAAAAKVDGSNRWYWRAHSRRLEAETIRDNVLAVTGKLNPKMGGRPVRVPIEKEVYDLIFTEYEADNLWPLSPDESQQYRRTLYLLNKRTVRLPMLNNFDQPDNMTSCPVRPSSTHALQSLSLMNSDFMHQQAQFFAARLQNECGTNRACQVSRAYKVALARAPKAVETKMAADFFKNDGLLEDFCLALMNRNEFVYLP